MNKVYLAAFLLCAFLLAAQEHQDPSAEPRTMPLWDGKAPGALGDADSDRPTISLYAASTGHGPTAAVIVFPGGSYGYLATNHEGRQPESKRRALTADDIRFTKKGEPLYAFVMGWPAKQAVIAALASNSKQAPGKIENVELLGHSGKLKWTRDDAGLKIELPEQKPCEHAVAFRIVGVGLV